MLVRYLGYLTRNLQSFVLNFGVGDNSAYGSVSCLFDGSNLELYTLRFRKCLSCQTTSPKESETCDP
jgi:hypothetical protein